MDLETLRQQISIVEVAQSMTTLRQTGNSGIWRGECPCCGGAGKAPFQVDARAKGRGPHFHCYACGANGDVINLWALKHRGSLMVGRAEFPNVVRGLAQHFQIEMPAGSARPKPSPSDQLREAVDEVWQAAHTWMKSRRAEVRGTSDPVASPMMPLGYLDRSLNAHLNALGVSRHVRERACLDEHTLTPLSEGDVVLRFHTAQPVGLSQSLPTSGSWRHLIANGVTPDLAFLTPLPHGRITDRHFVLATDLPTAEGVAAALKAIGSDPSCPRAKETRHLGVLTWDQGDPAALSGLKSVTVRATIIAAPVGSEGYASHIAERIIRHGLGTRLTMLHTDMSAVSLLDAITAAPDYFAWQLRRAGSDDTHPNVSDAGATFSKRVRPMIEAITDPVARTVFAERVKTLALQS